MAENRTGFYFDKLDLFNNIKNMTTILGVDPLLIETPSNTTLPNNNNNTGSTTVINGLTVLERLYALEQGIANINTTGATITYVDSELSKKVNKLGDTLLGNLELLVTPTLNTHLVNKQYVDDITTVINTNLTALETLVNSINNLFASTSYVDTQDQVIQAQIDSLSVLVNTLNVDPVTKSYVDAADALKVNKAGDSLTGPLFLYSEPLQPLEAASKSYVDNIAAGLTSKSTARLLSDTNIPGVFLNNNLTSLTTGALTIDGKLVNNGDIVLLTNQTDPSQNGSYIVVNSGTASTNYSLDRTIYANASSEIPGSFYFITDGILYKSTGWVLIVNDITTFTLNTDPITVTQVSGQGTYIAGNGLTLNGNTFNINVVNSSRLSVNQTSIDLVTTGVIAGTYNKVTVDSYGRVLSGSQITPADIPNLDWSKITTGLPTTLSGYGITDAVNINGTIMLGDLILASDPTLPLQAVTKQYVDNSLTNVINYIDTKDSFILTQVNSLQSTVNTLNTDPVTKSYVDIKDSLKLNLTGGTLTGPLTLSGLPTSSLEASTKGYVDNEISTLTTYIDAQDNILINQVSALQSTVNTLNTDPVTKTYVDAQDALKVNKAGDSLTGPLLLNSDPIQPLEAATKQYVDNVAQGLRARPSVRLATTTSLPVTYNTSSKNLVSNTPSVLIIDNVTPDVGDRILIKDQTTLSNNGVYEVVVNDGVSSYILTRTNLFNESIEIPGGYFFVTDGVVNKATSWVAIVNNPSTFTLDLDSITFSQVNKFPGYQGSNGLVVSNGIISLITSTNGGLLTDNIGIKLKLSDNSLITDSTGVYVNPTIINSKINKAGDTMTGFLTLNSDPTANLHAVTKQYVDANILTVTNNLNTQTTNLQNQLSAISNIVTLLNVDPVTKSYVDAADALKVSKAGDSLTGPLLLNSDPVQSLEAATKQYVDSSLLNLDISNLTIGTLSINLLPSFNGDVTSIQGTNILNLVPTGVTPGTYSLLTVDSKGRIITASNLTTNDLPDVDWNTSIINKPTTLSGYGIIDGLNKTGDTMTGSLVLNSDPIQSLEAATKQYVDNQDSLKVSKTGDTMTGQLSLTLSPVSNEHATNKDYVDTEIDKAVPVGTIILSTLDELPEGYLKCNGSYVNTLLYEKLYYTLKNKILTIYDNGKYWEQQWLLKQPPVNSFRFKKYAGTPTKISNHKSIVLDNNRTIIFGGYSDNAKTVISPITYRVNYDSKFRPIKFTPIASLPVGLVDYEVIYFNEYVFIIGGYDGTNFSSVIYKAKYNYIVEDFEIGQSGAWEQISIMPTGLAGHKSIVIKDYLYIIGGQDSVNSLSNAIFRAKIFSNGEIGNWLPTATLPLPLRDFGLVLANDKIHIIGGNTSTTVNSFTPTNTVFTSDFEFKYWIQGDNLPVSMCGMNVIVSRKIMFLLGNRLVNGPTKDIYYSYIDESGNISTFTLSTGRLSVAVTDSTCIINNKEIYLFGGYESGNKVSNKTFKADYFSIPIIYENRKLDNKLALGYGKPHLLQYEFNEEISNLTTHSLDTQLPIGIQNAKTIITKNNLYIFNYYSDVNLTTTSTNIYKIPINPDNTLATPISLTLPFNVSFSEVLVNRNYVFVLGGKTSINNIVDTIYVSHILQNGDLSNWQISNVTLPIPLYNFTSLIIKNKIYILGGKTINDLVNKDIFMATISSGNITNFKVVGSMPDYMYSFKAGVIKDKLCIFGGLRSGIPSNTTYYSLINKDGTLDKWNNYLSLSTTFYNYEMVITKHNVILLNGDSTTDTGKTIIGTIDQDGRITNWSIINSFNNNIRNLSVAVGYNKLFTIGGLDITTSTLSSDISYYNFSGGRNSYINEVNPIMLDNLHTPYPYKQQNEFNHFPDLVLNSISISNISNSISITKSNIIAIKDKIYSLGGYDGTTSINSIYSYNITNGIISPPIIETITLPIPLYNFRSFILGNKLYIVGGNSSSDSLSESNVYINQLDIYGNITSNFTIMNTLPIPLNSFEIVYTSSRVYILGGRSNGNIVDTTYYTTISNTSDNNIANWSVSNLLPEPITDFKAITIGKYVYIIGGINPSGQSNKVFRAKISSDGIIGNFTLYGTLPIPISNFELISTGAVVHLIGGLTTGNLPLNTIYNVSTKNNTLFSTVLNGILNDISLDTLTLPNTYFNLQAIITSTKLYMFNGIITNTPNMDILETSFKGGYDNYYYNQSLFDPIMFQLPDLTEVDTNNFEYKHYIKY